jgi:hypothetical protein
VRKQQLGEPSGRLAAMRESLIYLEPWSPVSGDQGLLESELRKELSPRHPLFSLTTTAIARRRDCDDVLFEIENTERRVAVVHLTWSSKQEDDPRYPFYRVFADRDEFANLCMKMDHENYES